MRQKFRPHSVLVVDDDPHFLSAISRQLRRDCWDVTTVTTVKEALTSAAEDPPEVALVDVLMPEGGAIGFLQATQARQLDVPMVMMSGVKSILGVARETLRDSVPFLEKPFSIEEATGALRQAANLGQERTLMDDATPSPQRELDLLMVQTVADVAAWPALKPPLQLLWPALIAQRTVDLPKVMAAIEADHALSQDLLVVLNRTMGGVSRNAARTIGEALSRLSPSAAPTILLELLVHDQFTTTTGVHARPIGKLFRRVCQVARLASALRLLGPQDVEWQALQVSTRFAHVMLQNVGMLIGAQALYGKASQRFSESDSLAVLMAYQRALMLSGSTAWEIPVAPAVASTLTDVSLIAWNALTPADEMPFAARASSSVLQVRGRELVEQKLPSLSTLATSPQTLGALLGI